MEINYSMLDNYTDIQDIFNMYNVKKPFLCCGKSFQKTEIFKYLQQFDLTVFDNIRPNPRFENMVEGAKVFAENDCDFMIAAGGGSVIDSAKMIRLMTTNSIDTCLKIPMKNNGIKTLFIATTSGSGAEVTKSSVFYINEKDKMSIANYCFLPDFLYYDSNLLSTVPLYQRKCTCLDALCHCIESYWSVKSTKQSKIYAKNGIIGFFKCKDEYMQNTSVGNEKMMMVSKNGGQAINITGTTAAHAMCYNITMNCGTSHGHSVAVLLAQLWQYMIDNHSKLNDQRGQDYVLSTFDEIAQFMGGNNAQDGVNIFKSLLNEFELPYPTATENQVKEFVGKVDVQRLGNNPVALSNQDVFAIYNNTIEQITL